MAWKDVPVGSTVNNKLWVTDGIPGVKTKIIPNRGFHTNIPSIDGGVGTILNYDDTIVTKLSDDDILTDVVYSGNYYTLTTTGNAVGLELTHPSILNSIDIYVNGTTGATILSNTFHILTSIDGANWSRVESIASSVLSLTCEANYGSVTIPLSTSIISKFVAIRSATDFILFDGSNRIARIREIRLFTPEEIGVEGDIATNRATGNMYEKINGLWQLTYTAPEIPQHLVGSSMTPPSAVGRPIGSFYIVQNS